MTCQIHQTANLNREFAQKVLERAADFIVEHGLGNSLMAEPSGWGVIEALMQSRDELRAFETDENERARTYGYVHLIRDLSDYIVSRKGWPDDAISPITSWGAHLNTGQAEVIATLRDAANDIGRLAFERTVNHKAHGRHTTNPHETLRILQDRAKQIYPHCSPLEIFTRVSKALGTDFTKDVYMDAETDAEINLVPWDELEEEIFLDPPLLALQALDYHYYARTSS